MDKQTLEYSRSMEGFDPFYATAGSSGFDIRSPMDVVLFPGSPKKIPTGLKFRIPAGFELQVRPKSSISMLGILTAFGTIDADYRGDVAIILTNLSNDTIEFKRGRKIAQMVMCPVEIATLKPVGDISHNETVRGAGGFGSTGQ